MPIYSRFKGSVFYEISYCWLSILGIYILSSIFWTGSTGFGGSTGLGGITGHTGSTGFGGSTGLGGSTLLGATIIGTTGFLAMKAFILEANYALSF